MTGGGFIKMGSAKATFAVTGGSRKGGALRGHLTYHDHGSNGPTVKGTGVTAYAMIDATTRRIGGTATVNGMSGFIYQVDVSEKGGPGKRDTFSIRVSNAAGYAYTASGNLAGGNIQLHKRPASDSCDGDDDDDGGDGDGGDDDHHGHDDDRDEHEGKGDRR